MKRWLLKYIFCLFTFKKYSERMRAYFKGTCTKSNQYNLNAAVMNHFVLNIEDTNKYMQVCVSQWCQCQPRNNNVKSVGENIQWIL